MLILSRKVNENIVIDGRIIVKIVRLDGENVKLGIEAPADVPVHRQEVYDEIIRSNREALSKGRQPVPRIASRRPPVPPSGPTPLPPAGASPAPGSVETGTPPIKPS
jgi:carbon storage regulator